MPPTLADRLRPILEPIEDIDRLLKGKSVTAYAGDRHLQLTIERLLEIICEASQYIPDDVREGERSIPWRKLVDFGNRLRHAYHRMDAEVVWSVVVDDSPALKSFAEKVRQNAGR